MTPHERRRSDVINGSRRKRIARGSGTTVEEVNRLLKQFVQMRKMLKTMGGMAERRKKGGSALMQMLSGSGLMTRRGVGVGIGDRVFDLTKEETKMVVIRMRNGLEEAAVLPRGGDRFARRRATAASWRSSGTTTRGQAAKVDIDRERIDHWVARARGRPTRCAR